MKITRTDVATRMKMIFIEVLDVKATDLPDDASIVDDLGADALKISQLSMMIEEEFGVFITTELMGKLVTVGDAIEFVAARERDGI
ncbi:acyl carrier protein [Ensifer adhaerens]|uniref:acyl carrier protein n=1 Tax=Ensifer canadensis TaxID=555315 RepID=UPI001AEF312F|nr:acyl carrier protein [Ensifer canadensis]NOV20846.1 acyl carrier protein [Ensifer canadensis]